MRSEWGPFTVITGNAGPRRIPKARLSRIEQKGQAPYLVGFWISWAGRQVSITRNRWYQREATWRNQAVCRIRRHQPTTVVTKAELLGATPDAAEIRILDSHQACRRCELVLEGPKWVNR